MKRLTGILATAMFVAVFVGTALSASAASKATYYLALGDSLAAGCQPTGPPFCFGGQGYADHLFKAERGSYTQLQLVNQSCPGESTGSMIGGPAAGSPCTYQAGSQLNSAVSFLQAHLGQVAFVTID